MIRSNLRLKLLGLSAMLLGLMAFSASSAQGAAWMVGANNITSTLLPTLQVKELRELKLLPTDQGKHLMLLTEIGKTKVHILCTVTLLSLFKFVTAGSIPAGALALLSGCDTYLNGLLSAACVPKSSGQPNGSIQSEKLKGQLEESGLIQIKPETGENFAVLKFGEECSLPESVPMKGTLFIKDSNNIETSTLDHSFEVDNAASHLYVISLTAEHEAEIHVILIVTLTGTDADSAWSGLPKG